MRHLARRAPYSSPWRGAAAATSRTASDAYLRKPSTRADSPPLSPREKQALDAAIRVDHAGEIAANWIYRGQLAVFQRDPAMAPLIQKMWDGEKKHLQVMEKLVHQHRVAPTILTEVAKVAGFGLGAATALMGREAAMTCTEAVETVIGEHYDDQLRDLDGLQVTHSSIPELKEIIRELRDDELEHLDTAVEYDSQRAPAHALLSAIIEVGCSAAIQVCKRI
ncbi:COQ7-domain-containing protein [Clavulina sp. PMI_390]|nr:COQ7-domain-containing protein [Clavulina sp. PMI_390]